MTTYVIGDIQGCGQQMDALLKQISASSPAARIIFVGDLVNRGPDSLRTLQKIRMMGSDAQSVLGNHDLHLLAVSQNIRKPHASDTLDEILNSPERDDLLNWLRHRPLALLEDGHLVVHAGVLPQWSAEQTVALAHEVECVIRGPDWVDFLREMYGNTPSKWNDALSGVERLRCIINALTRLRFCTPDGTMDFDTKEGADAALPGYFPWFDVPERQTQNLPIVFGHWSALGLLLRPHIIGLDTGCVWGGKLTAIRLEDRALLQVDCPQCRKPGKIV